MPQNKLSAKKIKGILISYDTAGLSQSQLARVYNVSRPSIKKYLMLYKKSDLSLSDLKSLKNKDIINALYLNVKDSQKSPRFFFLTNQFPIIHNRLCEEENISLKYIWEEYKQTEPYGYKYSQFAAHYNNWREKNEQVFR